jgi:hypothetical protein
MSWSDFEGSQRRNVKAKSARTVNSIRTAKLTLSAVYIRFCQRERVELLTFFLLVATKSQVLANARFQQKRAVEGHQSTWDEEL